MTDSYDDRRKKYFEQIEKMLDVLSNQKPIPASIFNEAISSHRDYTKEENIEIDRMHKIYAALIEQCRRVELQDDEPDKQHVDKTQLAKAIGDAERLVSELKPILLEPTFVVLLEEEYQKKITRMERFLNDNLQIPPDFFNEPNAAFRSGHLSGLTKQESAQVKPLRDRFHELQALCWDRNVGRKVEEIQALTQEAEQYFDSVGFPDVSKKVEQLELNLVGALKGTPGQFVSRDRKSPKEKMEHVVAEFRADVEPIFTSQQATEEKLENAVERKTPQVEAEVPAVKPDRQETNTYGDYLAQWIQKIKQVIESIFFRKPTQQVKQALLDIRESEAERPEAVSNKGTGKLPGP